MAKILVVDDDPNILHMLKTMLTIEGHFAIGASSGDRAWSILLDNQDFDLLICDVVMPHTDGRELVTRIRQDTARFAFPIIMISGFVPFKEIRGILELGVDKFVAKPFHTKDLLADINSCLS